jgi:hypothetical protein
MTTTIDDEAFTPEQAGQFLGGVGDPVPPSLLAKWRCSGTGPEFIKVGRRVRYSVAALESWKRAQTRRGTRDAS